MTDQDNRSILFPLPVCLADQFLGSEKPIDGYDRFFQVFNERAGCLTDWAYTCWTRRMTSNCNVAKFSLRFPHIFWYPVRIKYPASLPQSQCSECSPTVLPRAFLFCREYPQNAPGNINFYSGLHSSPVVSSCPSVEQGEPTT